MMMMMMMLLDGVGVSYECDKVDLKVNEGSPRCPRCGQRVYFNEEKKALGKSWHTRCFTCCQYTITYIYFYDYLQFSLWESFTHKM